jgi:hypothetical protein
VRIIAYEQRLAVSGKPKAPSPDKVKAKKAKIADEYANEVFNYGGEEKTRLEKILWQVIGIVSLIFLSLVLIKVKK